MHKENINKISLIHFIYFDTKQTFIFIEPLQLKIQQRYEYLIKHQNRKNQWPKALKSKRDPNIYSLRIST